MKRDVVSKADHAAPTRHSSFVIPSDFWYRTSGFTDLLVVRRPHADHPQLEEADDLLLAQLVRVQVIGHLAVGGGCAAADESVLVFNPARHRGDAVVDGEERV